MNIFVLSSAQTQFKIISFRELLHPRTGHGIFRLNHSGILNLVVRFSCFTVVCSPYSLASSANCCSPLSEALLTIVFIQSLNELVTWTERGTNTSGGVFPEITRQNFSLIGWTNIYLLRYFLEHVMANSEKLKKALTINRTQSSWLHLVGLSSIN